MLIKAKLENTMSMELAFSSLACQPTRKTNVGLIFMRAIGVLAKKKAEVH